MAFIALGPAADQLGLDKLLPTICGTENEYHLGAKDIVQSSRAELKRKDRAEVQGAGSSSRGPKAAVSETSKLEIEAANRATAVSGLGTVITSLTDELRTAASLPVEAWRLPADPFDVDESVLSGRKWADIAALKAELKDKRSSIEQQSLGSMQGAASAGVSGASLATTMSSASSLN